MLRQPLDVAGSRPITQLSGGERKRLVLESLLSSEIDIVLLDEPDNFLDLAGKRWLERTITASSKTILFVTHDREFLDAVADSVVTLEGFGAWTHPGRFATYDAARRVRHADQAVLLGRWEAEEQRLRQNYRMMKQRAASSDANAGRAKAAESRWQRFVAAGPPPPPPAERTVHMRLKGSRTGDLVLRTAGLEIAGLTEPFDVEFYRGDRVAVLGPNGSGKSHFLRMLGGDATVATHGEWNFGAGVEVGLFHQTDEVGWLKGRTGLEALGSLDLNEHEAMAALARYGLEDGARRPYETLSGGQKARLQVLGLELRGVNVLLLDEPTDNLDMASAAALEEALRDFRGTVLTRHPRSLVHARLRSLSRVRSRLLGQGGRRPRQRAARDHRRLVLRPAPLGRARPHLRPRSNWRSAVPDARLGRGRSARELRAQFGGKGNRIIDDSVGPHRRHDRDHVTSRRTRRHRRASGTPHRAAADDPPAIRRNVRRRSEASCPVRRKLRRLTTPQDWVRHTRCRA